jgi:Uma2 family endonuclease
MIAIQQPNLTSLEEFLRMPETKPASEYINRRIYQKSMPQGKHSTLQSEIITLINQQIKIKKIGYAFPELRCTFGDRSIVPDICVFEWERIPLGAAQEIVNKIVSLPDWIIEILSPEQSSIRVIDKITFCLKHGTKLGWLVDPQERLVMIFAGDRLPENKEGNDLLPVLLLDHWQLSVADLFDLLSFG